MVQRNVFDFHSNRQTATRRYKKCRH